MASLVINTAGLLGRWDWSAAGDWTFGSGCSRIADPCRITWGKLPNPLFTPGAPDSINADGAREAFWLKKANVDYCIFDSGNGTDGWQQCIARSFDRWKTYELKQLGIGLGAYAAVATGIFAEFDGVFYVHRVTATSTFAPPNNGLPLNPYHWDIWENEVDPWDDDAWEEVRTVPVGSPTWCNAENLPCSIIQVGSDYIMYAEGAGSTYAAGHGVASAPDGAPTMAATPDLTEADFFGFPPENGKTIWDETLQRYVQFLNLIVAGSGAFTARNAIAVSTTYDFASKSIFNTQEYRFPLDCNGTAIGVATPGMYAEGIAVNDGGYVPGVFDTDATDFTPGWFMGRPTYGQVWEPATHCLFYDPPDSSEHLAENDDFPNDDFVAEGAFYWTDSPGANEYFDVCYRRTGTDGYRVRFYNDNTTPPDLLLMDGTLVESGTGLPSFAGLMNRYRIEVSGDSHKITLNGELQIDATDSEFDSGDGLALAFKGTPTKVWPLSITASDTITIQGLTPSATYTLRTKGWLPLDDVTANGSGVVTYVVPHSPFGYIEVDGQDLTGPDGLLWAGTAATVRQTVPATSCRRFLWSLIGRFWLWLMRLRSPNKRLTTSGFTVFKSRGWSKELGCWLPPKDPTITQEGDK